MREEVKVIRIHVQGLEGIYIKGSRQIKVVKMQDRFI